MITNYPQAINITSRAAFIRPDKMNAEAPDIDAHFA